MLTMTDTDVKDIDALVILDEQLKVLDGIHLPSSLEHDDGKVSTASLILDKVKTCVKTVSEYLNEITSKIEDLRDMIREYDIEISENLEEIMKKHLLSDTTVLNSTEGMPTRNNIAEKKLKHFRNMQCLSKQDHELKELIAKTEEIILRSETQVEYSNDDISSLQEHLYQWSTSLDRIEKKQLKPLTIKENSNSDEIVSMSTEVEEDNTENITSNGEADMSDSRNWPKFVYELKGKNRFKQNICCVIMAIHGSANKTDIVCEAADSYHLLDSCLEVVDEQVISGMITIRPQEGKKIQFEVPILVYIPIVSHNPALVPAIKYFKGDSWAVGHPTPPPIKVKGAHNVTFVGTSIPLRDLVCLQCIAVARHRRQEIDVDEKGISFELSDDRNMKINIPPLTFPYETTVVTKVVSWKNICIEQDRDWDKHLKHVRRTGSYLEISCDGVTEVDLEVCLYNLGWFVDTEQENKISVNQETLFRCSRWLVNNMDPIKRLNNHDNEISDTKQTRVTKGDNVRMILQDLKDSSDEDFNNFLETLTSSNQQEIVLVLNQITEKVSLSRLQTHYTDNNFNTEYQLRQDKLYIVLKTDKKDWTILLHESRPMNPKSRVITLPKGHCIYKVICLTSVEELTSFEIEKASCILEGLTYLTNVCIICRQNKEDLHDVIIQCIKSSESEKCHNDLCERGYSEGPPITMTFGIIDGEEIEIRFEDNIEMKKYKKFPLKIKYFVNIEPLKISSRIDILNTNDQGGDGTYHGKLVYKVPEGHFTNDRSGYMEIHFPKKLETNIDDFIFTATDPVKILARHISWVHTNDNPYSTRWVTYVGYLVDRDMPIYRQIIKDIDEENNYTSQRDRCEAFILKWSKESEISENEKIRRIIDALTDDDNRDHTQRFVDKYLPPNGLLTNKNIKDIGFIIARDWRIISERLSFSENDIGRIITTETGLVRQSIRMLDQWRLSDTVILSLNDALHSLCDSAMNLESHQPLLDYMKVF